MLNQSNIMMNEPMHFLYNAAFLNEKGVALMNAGKQHEAFEVLICAVESLDLLSQLMESQQYLDHRSLSCLPSSRKRQQIRNNMGLHNCIISADDTFEKFCLPAAGSTGHETFVYNEAFRFTPREIAHFEHGNEEVKHYMKLFRAILTFNCALTFHQRSIGAFESVKCTAESVASNLYMDAMNILQDCFSTLDSSRVLAATINNAAMLFYSMQDFERFECFQTELHSLLVDIESTYPRSVDPRCLKCLFFNATLLTVPQTAGAA